MEEKITFIQTEIEKIAFKKVGTSDSLLQSRLLDSIALVDLLVAIEEEFGINIPTAEINPDNFDTIDRMMIYITKKINHDKQ
jgi:acyl carrier protein